MKELQVQCAAIQQEAYDLADVFVTLAPVRPIADEEIERIADFVTQQAFDLAAAKTTTSLARSFLEMGAGSFHEHLTDRLRHKLTERQKLQDCSVEGRS